MKFTCLLFLPDPSGGVILAMISFNWDNCTALVDELPAVPLAGVLDGVAT